MSNLDLDALGNSAAPPLDSTRRNNQQAWDRMARAGHSLTRPATAQELASPLAIIDGSGWLGGNIRDWNILCLAAGGGRHGPLYAAAGGRVTVVDLSAEMLQRDREVAAEHGLQLTTLQTSMDQLQMLPEAHFDLVIHPVSTCYIASVARLFPEVARVTKPQGLYISQHKQPANLQASLESYTGHYTIEHAYYDSRAVPPATSPNPLREPGTQEFIHSWNDLLGGICRAGFTIEDVSEPAHGKADALPGSFAHRCYYIAPYIRLKARRAGAPAARRLITL